MATVHSLNIGIKANAKPAIAALGSLKVAIGSVVAALAVRQVGRTFLDTAEHIDKMSKASRALGASLQETMQLDFAGGLSGVEFETIAASINKMRKGIVESASKGKKFAGVFDSAKLAAMGTSDQIATMANKIGGIKNATEQTALAMKAFGKAGAKMIPLLEGGSGAIDNMRKQFDFLTGTVSDGLGLAVERMNADLDRLKQQWMGLKIATVAALTPVVTEILGTIIPAIKTWQESLAPGGSFAAAIFETVADKVRSVSSEVDDLRIRFLELVQTLQRNFNYISQLVLGTTKSDVQALSEEIERLKAARAGGQSAGTSDFFSRFKRNRDIFGALTDTGSPSSSPSRAALLGAGGGVAEALKNVMPLDVKLVDESAKALVDGTVEAADEVNRLQRNHLLAAEFARVAKEKEAADEAKKAARKANEHLRKIETNTKNAVVLAPAGL